MGGPNPYPGAPRWVKLAWLCVAALVLLSAILLHAGTGGHHPGGLHGGHG